MHSNYRYIFVIFEWSRRFNLTLCSYTYFCFQLLYFVHTENPMTGLFQALCLVTQTLAPLPEYLRGEAEDTGTIEEVTIFSFRAITYIILMYSKVQ